MIKTNNEIEEHNQRERERLVLENSNLKAAIHAVHGLLVPLGNQINPSVLAIREALQILRSNLY